MPFLSFYIYILVYFFVNEKKNSLWTQFHLKNICQFWLTSFKDNPIIACWIIRNKNCKYFEYNVVSRNCFLYDEGVNNCTEILRDLTTDLEKCRDQILPLGKLYLIYENWVIKKFYLSSFWLLYNNERCTINSIN